MNQLGQNTRSLFPQLGLQVNQNPFVYLDSAATTLKPLPVIDRLRDYYLNESANIHRGSHFFGDLGTKNFENAREQIANYLGAKNSTEIVFTRGTTESINLVAQSYAANYLKAGDTLLITAMEHHSNIVPWQLAQQKAGFKIEMIPLTTNASLDLDWYHRRLQVGDVRFVAFTHVSNVLGAINPAQQMVRLAHEFGAKTLIDGAQAVAAMPVSVNELQTDFYVFSGHKLFAPNGVGVLFGTESCLESMPPFLGGGSMIEEVFVDHSTYLRPPQRFEAGTPSMGPAIALGQACQWLQSIGLSNVLEHEKTLTQKAYATLAQDKKVRLFGPPDPRTNIVSFLIDGLHPSDVGHLLDQQGVAVRVGHLCCQPLMRALGVKGVIRISFSIYNNDSDLDQFFASLQKTREVLA